MLSIVQKVVYQSNRTWDFLDNYYFQEISWYFWDILNLKSRKYFVSTQNSTKIEMLPEYHDIWIYIQKLSFYFTI